MISSPGWVCLPKATPGSRSTRTWTASRPGTLRSWRCRSVRLIPAVCACAMCGTKTLPEISAAIASACVVFNSVLLMSNSLALGFYRSRRSQWQRLAGLLIDDVFGVPVRPVRIVQAAVALLVLAMRGRCTAQRDRELGRGGERGVAIYTPGQSCGELLEQPAIAVGIPERGE